MKPEIIDFTIDGDGISEIVGEKDYYKDVEIFLKDANFEYCDMKEPYTKSDVTTGFVKWYTEKERESQFICPFLEEGGCYSFCDKDDEGAEEVFIIDLKEDNNG